MSNLFARLEELSTQLNASSDALSESIKRVEAKLASLRLGVSVWLQEVEFEVEPTVNRDGKIDGTSYVLLGYDKIDGKWCLAISEQTIKLGTTHPEHGPKLTPLLQASRDYRIKAWQLIPELIKALEARAETELKTMQSITDISKTL